MAEGQEEQIAIWNVNKALETLLVRLNDPPYKLFVTGENNFRFSVYPEYKANRLKVPRPTHLKAVKDHLIVNWKAIESDGCEADDLLGIEQMAEPGESMIVSIDKDLDMIPGWHFSPEISRKGIVVKPERRYLVSPTEALRWFYTQLLVGDPTDNIKGVRGIGKVGAKEFLDGRDSEESMFRIVQDVYGNDEEMEMNARCLWIQRSPQENIVERWKELFDYKRAD
jgi:5'-3' exonuclease